MEATELPEITDPRLRLLHDLWQIYRDDAPAPRRADLDVFDSPLWLGHLSLLEAIEDGLHFRYLIYGRALAVPWSTFTRIVSHSALDAMPRVR